ncbi:hypothetical protein VTI74DRAFT_11579 [Chaetomium olivicolor]
MSDIPDRFGLPFNGRTGFGLPLPCEYPVAASSSHSHGDLAGVRDQETASSSATSDDFSDSDYFDWDLYARDEEVTDVTTQSDVPSETQPAVRPLLPIPDGPAAADTSHEEDSPMPDAPSDKLPHVWPSVSEDQLPRDLTIHLESSPSPPPTTDMPPLPSQKRTRTVKDPEETSMVRDMGACYHCRMNKSKVCCLLLLCPAQTHADLYLQCNPSPVCEGCRKRSRSSCIRKPLVDIVRQLTCKSCPTHLIRKV